MFTFKRYYIGFFKKVTNVSNFGVFNEFLSILSFFKAEIVYLTTEASEGESPEEPPRPRLSKDSTGV